MDEPLNIDWTATELLLSDVLGTEADMIYKQIEEEVEKTPFQAMLKLSPREKKIIQLRFGLEDGNEKTQKEVADVLGISHIHTRLKREFCGG